MCIRIGNGSPVWRWGVLGAYCADAVLQARYTSHRLLSKCYYRESFLLPSVLSASYIVVQS